MSNWDNYFLKLVYQVAEKSKDPKTKIGAILVNPDKSVISMGFNGPPMGVWDIPQRLDRPEKYFFFEHAERNAIFLAAKNGIKTNGSVLYTQGIPCCDCARGVIQSGVCCVVIHKLWPYTPAYESNWTEGIKRSIAMFEEACVLLVEVDKELEVSGFCDGNRFNA
jgi:dCMP deaminase